MKIIILGSTGFIGRETLQVAEHLGIEVVAVSGYRNLALLEEQCRKFHPDFCWVAQEGYNELKVALADTDVTVVTGLEQLNELAALQADLLVNALVGIAGLLPTLSAIESGKTIALANKETLVAGGELVMKNAAAKNVKIIPVDSEHSAIFQCLQGEVTKPEKLLLTASGGPFFGFSKQNLRGVTMKQALNHPTWSMGSKITIDSATLMNKGLELIEAVHLFDFSPDAIEILIHRESIIHSMVQFPDKSIIAQLSSPDMRLPIQYAITYPERIKSPIKEMSFAELGSLSFFKPDEETFTLLSLARRSIEVGGNIPAAMNAANEYAVEQFLKGRIGFVDIFDYVEEATNDAKFVPTPSINDILETDKLTREYLRKRLKI